MLYDPICQHYPVLVIYYYPNGIHELNLVIFLKARNLETEHTFSIECSYKLKLLKQYKTFPLTHLSPMTSKMAQGHTTSTNMQTL